MKKTYMIPEMEVVLMSLHQPMLAGSMPLSSDTTDTQFGREFDDLLSDDNDVLNMLMQ